MAMKEIFTPYLVDIDDELLPDLGNDCFISDAQFQPLTFAMPPTIPSPSLTAEMDENSEDLVPKLEGPADTAMIFPVPVYGKPIRHDFTGEYNFNVLVRGIDTNKKKYMYSYMENRIYVDMQCCFALQFNWDYQSAPTPLFIRSTVVFTEESQWEKRVERCVQHKHMKTNEDVAIVNHVLRSASSPGTPGVYYCGDEKRPDSWYSVLVEFPSAPNEPNQSCDHAYMFSCKNSCSSGINRRSTEIVFTLEDAYGYVYGRQTVGVRVCSCPRRDLLRDEAEKKGAIKPGKRSMANSEKLPPSKKMQLENDELTNEVIYTLPKLQVVGSKTLETGVMVMINMMKMAALNADKKSSEKYTKSIAGLQSYLDELKSNEKLPDKQ